MIYFYPRERKHFEWAGRHDLGHIFQFGDIRTQLAYYSEAGVDCISVDATLLIVEACALLAERIVLAGNVKVGNTVSEEGSQLLCKVVSECLAWIPDPFSIFTLMPSCDLPFETPLRNVKALLACADLYIGTFGCEGAVMPL